MILIDLTLSVLCTLCFAFVLFICFVGRRLELCVRSVSGLFILACPFGFFLTLTISCELNAVTYICIVEGHAFKHQEVLMMYNEIIDFRYIWSGIGNIYHMHLAIRKA